MAKKPKEKPANGMKRYAVSIPIGASIVVYVDAESVEAAIERAIDEANAPSICHQCSRELEVGEAIIDEITEDCVSEIT